MTAYTSLALRVFVGLVFAASACTKLATLSRFNAFASWMDTLPIPGTSHSKLIAALVAACEGMIVVFVAIPATSAIGLIIAAGLLCSFVVLVVRLIRRGVSTPCRCFGSSASPLSVRHVVRDLLLLSGALLGLLNVTATLPPLDVGLIVSVFAGTAAALVVVAWDDVMFLIIGAGVRSRSSGASKSQPPGNGPFAVDVERSRAS